MQSTRTLVPRADDRLSGSLSTRNLHCCSGANPLYKQAGNFLKSIGAQPRLIPMTSNGNKEK
jgi:hypothetical protein